MKVIISILLALVILISVSVPAFATALPDSTPTIPGHVYVYRNLLETGDFFYIWEANIPYAVVPTDPVTSTFVWRLIALDGVTTLGSTTGFVYQSGGYGYNVYSMYFSAATATAAGMVWGTTYTLRLSGNPAAFATPPIYNSVLNASDYTALVAQSDNQTELAALIITIAQDLTTQWGLGALYSLTQSSETGTVLSAYGEIVFRGAIYGAQALAPTAFSTQVTNVEVTDRSWNTTYQTSLENQNAGTWIETAHNASIAVLGTNFNLFDIIIITILMTALYIGMLRISNDPYSGLVEVCFVLIVATRLGMIGLTVIGLVAAICILYIGTRIWRNVPGT